MQIIACSTNNSRNLMQRVEKDAVRTSIWRMSSMLNSHHMRDQCGHPGDMESGCCGRHLVAEFSMGSSFEG